MEQVHLKALEAIQPFVHLATSTTSASPRFVANLITNATSSPSTFVFAELLETSAIQSLRSPETPVEYQPYLTLLEIFAWGTWHDYHCSSLLRINNHISTPPHPSKDLYANILPPATPNLPPLNDAQTQKLRLLSLMSFSKIENPLTYSTVMTSLSLSSHGELENLVTKAIYSSLISARLSPTTSPPVIQINSIAPLRDVPPQIVDPMISVLSEWEDRCRNVIGGIEAEIAKIRADAEQRHTEEKLRADRLQRSLDGWEGEDEDGDGAAGGGSGASGDAGAAGSKRSFRPLRDQFSKGGRRPGPGGGYKREFNATNEFVNQYGYSSMTGSEMDLDGGADGDGGRRILRNTKRVLGMGHRP